LFVKPPLLVRLFYPTLLWKKQTAAKKLWLTFDDGPQPEVTPWILAVLKEVEIKATFFLVGEQMEEFPELVNAIKEDGHLIANHSYSHKHGWFTANKTYFQDVEKCQKLMPMNRLFRPPYGKLSCGQIRKLKGQYKLILWDVLSMDFNQNTTADKVKKNVLKNAEKGSVIVFHNNKKSFENLRPILKETIAELKNKGFSFSTTW
jgi:peptidoglycan/xylan/chitin deacetylase (PgdA/CDA1 family)